jgi:hypothetical protein
MLEAIEAGGAVFGSTLGSGTTSAQQTRGGYEYLLSSATRSGKA